MTLPFSQKAKNQIQEIFNLFAKDDQITCKNLSQIFHMVNYNIDENEIKSIYKTLNKSTRYDDKINFDSFMKLFQFLHSTDNKVDIKNAFRLIAIDNDNYIPKKQIVQILQEGQMTDVQINFILGQLINYMDKNGNFNYAQFLKLSQI